MDIQSTPIFSRQNSSMRPLSTASAFTWVRTTEARMRQSGAPLPSARAFTAERTELSRISHFPPTRWRW